MKISVHRLIDIIEYQKDTNLRQKINNTLNLNEISGRKKHKTSLNYINIKKIFMKCYFIEFFSTKFNLKSS